MKKYNAMEYVLSVFTVVFTLFTAGQVLAAETNSDTWSLVGSSKINPNKEQTSFTGGGATEGYYTEERYLGKTLNYTVNETLMSMADHELIQ